jgi:hypothetical protein
MRMIEEGVSYFEGLGYVVMGNISVVILVVAVMMEVYKMGLGEGGLEGEELNVTGGAESGDGGREKIWEKIVRIIRNIGPSVFIMFLLWKEIDCGTAAWEDIVPFWMLILLLILFGL